MACLLCCSNRLAVVFIPRPQPYHLPLAPLPWHPCSTSTIKRGDHVGWLQEQAICLAYLFWPVPVSHEDIRLMRASFMLTHRVPPGGWFREDCLPGMGSEE